jgi:hypothetical protein
MAKQETNLYPKEITMNKISLILLITGSLFLLSNKANADVYIPYNKSTKQCEESCNLCGKTPTKKVKKPAKKKVKKAVKKQKPIVEVVYVTKTIEKACPVIEEDRISTPIDVGDYIENNDYIPSDLNGNIPPIEDNLKPISLYQPNFFNASYNPNSLGFFTPPIQYVIIQRPVITTTVPPSEVPIPPSSLLLFSSLISYAVYRRKKAPTFTEANLLPSNLKS